jgi:putative toxin-antitoxin system antitoxin component (TIGR02293 family)
MSTEFGEVVPRGQQVKDRRRTTTGQYGARAIPRVADSKSGAGDSTSRSATRASGSKAAVLKDLTRFAQVYSVDPAVRIEAIKRGVNADDFARIARSMDRSKEQLGKTLGLSVTTVDRKAKAGETLSPEQGERLVGIARLIGQVQAMVERSGNPEGFDAARWLGRWLDEPLPALGGERPGDLMDTAEGRGLVSNLLSMAQSGAYA